MGKLRNADTPTGKFAQWMARKCRNHHPLAEIDVKTRQTTHENRRTYHSVAKGEVYVDAHNADRVLYVLEDGSAFQFLVEEVDKETVDQVEKVAVGY